MSITYIHQLFINNIVVASPLINNSSILLSISGGQDSLSLLKLVLDLQIYYQLKIGLIYFDHRLRLDTYLNLQHMLNISKITALKSYIYESLSNTNNELEYRKWRYKVLLHTVYTNQYSLIFTGHTFTDLSETLLQNIFRGTSIDGLASIGFVTQKDTIISIVRPLLNIERMETIWLCKKFCLPVWSDLTNYNCQLTRNRVREELIPYLQYYFQPKIYHKIHSLIEGAKLDIEYLQKATIRLYFLLKHPNYLAIQYSILLSQPLNLQYRIIKLFFKHTLQLVVATQIIDKIIIYLTIKRPVQVDVINYQLIIINNWLYFVLK